MLAAKIDLSPLVASAAIHSKVVVLFLFVAPTMFCGVLYFGPCFVVHYLVFFRMLCVIVAFSEVLPRGVICSLVILFPKNRECVFLCSLAPDIFIVAMFHSNLALNAIFPCSPKPLGGPLSWSYSNFY